MEMISDLPTREKVAPRKRRRISTLLAISILLLLLATVPPLINLGRYQRRIAGAISRAIGRPVSMDSVSLRLLPWPAFKIENLSVSEDPAFGAEPSLRAPEVIAEPRLSSLWRGRFELSHVELSDASVNLVRAADGRWNISSVLLQASHIENAPTAQTHAGPAPRFPFIQATGTRINFKRGIEKLPYSLLNADFSMSLARPGVWHVKLEAQPVRTDLELSLGDAGLLRLEGELHRASAFGTMPLALQAEWSHAPLGQLSRLLLGRDAGWRGDIDATAQLGGEIDRLDLRTHLLIANLHRQEFTPEQPFTVDATCLGLYSRANSSLNALRCRWPLGNGALLLTHTATQTQEVASAPAPAPAPALIASPNDLTLAAEKVPASFPVQLLGLLRPGLPGPQHFTGEITGSFVYTPGTRQLTGSATVPTLAIAGAGPSGAPLLLHELRLNAATAASAKQVTNAKQIASPARSTPPTLLLTGQPVALGLPTSPMTLSAELSENGYTLHANGAATLPALQAAASALHLSTLPQLSPPAPTPLQQTPDPPAQQAPDSAAQETPAPPTPNPSTLDPRPQATAQLALTATGPWLDGGEPAASKNQPGPSGDTGNTATIARASTTGTVHLQNVLWQTSWLPTPVTLTIADAAFSPGSILWATPAATLGNAPHQLRFSGSAQTPLHCKPAAPCATQFSLSTPSLNAGTAQSALKEDGQPPLLSTLFNQLQSSRFQVKQLQNSQLQASHAPLPALQGSIHVGMLTLGPLPLRDVSLVLSTVIPPPQPGLAPAQPTKTGAGQPGSPKTTLKNLKQSASAQPNPASFQPNPASTRPNLTSIQPDSASAAPVITIQTFDGHTLGGSLHLEGTLSLTGSIPRYNLHALLEGASAAQASALWHEDWGQGTLNATAGFSLAGSTATNLLSQIKGSFQASWLNPKPGGKPNDTLPSLLPRFTTWNASGTLAPSGMTLDQGTLLDHSALPNHNATTSTPATVTGTIGWDRTLDLQLLPSPNAKPTTITGTLAVPILTPPPDDTPQTSAH